MFRLVFCGTGAFGVPALRALVQAGHRPELVVTQPDRPAGRRRELKPSPVKLVAEEIGLPVFQPERLRDEAATERLREARPDLMLVVSYGQILRRATLDLPRLGCVNLHGSLLPRHRGASPITAAILAGDAETGVTAMVMDEGLDTGPVLAELRTRIFPDDDAASLHDRVAELGGVLIAPTLLAFADGSLAPVPQDDGAATVCRTLDRSDGRLDWRESAAALERRVRAMRPWPGAWTTVVRAGGETYELGVVGAAVASAEASAGKPGSISACDASTGAIVRCGEGALRLIDVKPSGGRQMSSAALVNGRRIAIDDRCV